MYVSNTQKSLQKVRQKENIDNYIIILAMVPPSLAPPHLQLEIQKMAGGNVDHFINIT